MGVADSDEALMRAYADGDAAAFGPLYDRHERPVYRYFLRHGLSPAAADDLLQETWMAVIGSAARYTVDARFTTWLYRIARSKLVDHWRATRRQVLFDDAANDPRVDDAFDDGGDDAVGRLAASEATRPDVQAMARQHAARFVAAVEALPAAQRDAFLLHAEGDLTLQQMAEITGVGVETAKSRLRYAMRRLRVACAAWLAPQRDGAAL